MSEVKTNKISSLASNNDITIDPDGTGDVVVASGHKLGVGTTSPAVEAHIQTSSGNPELRVESTGANYATMSVKNSSRHYSTQIRTDQSNAYVVRDETAGANRFAIDTSGNVGVNTTSPSSSTLMTIQSGSTTGALTLNGPTTNGYYASVVEMPSGSTYGFLFKNAGSAVGSIRINASSTAYNTSSDHRLKQGVEDMTGAIDRVKQLAPKRFNFIADPDDTTVDGFLAHEAQAVVPEAVTGTKDEVDADGDAVMQGIDQSKLVPLLTGALREAIAKIETLETKVAALEAGE